MVLLHHIAAKEHESFDNRAGHYELVRVQDAYYRFTSRTGNIVHADMPLESWRRIARARPEQ
jgi:hypothetical protein